VFVEQAKEKEVTPEEEFEQAFAEVTGEEEHEEQEKKSTEEVPQSEDEQNSEDAPEGDPTDEESGSEQADDPSGETDYKTLYEKEAQRTKSWEGRIKAANKRAEEAERKAKELEAGKSVAEKAVSAPAQAAEDEDLKNFFADYPELEKPFNKLVTLKGEAIARKIVQEEIQKIAPQITAIKVTQESEIERQHFSAIETAHPDYKGIVERGELDSWIQTQPSFIRNAMIAVTQKGSTEEVIELFDNFKKSNHKKNPTPPSSQNPKSKKAEDLAAVPASRRPIPKGKSNDDYDSAWEEAVSRK